MSPESAKTVGERLRLRTRGRAPGRRVLIVVLVVVAVYVFVLNPLVLVPAVKAAKWGTDYLWLLYAILAPFGAALLHARRRARREQCDTCGRDHAMKRVGWRKRGYVRMLCTHCRAGKTGTIEEEEGDPLAGF